jgi:hypothetical protein
MGWLLAVLGGNRNGFALGNDRAGDERHKLSILWLLKLRKRCGLGKVRPKFLAKR